MRLWDGRTIIAMATAVTAHSQKLFADLVSALLCDSMDHYRIPDDEDWSFPAHDMPDPTSVRVEHLEVKLLNVEATVNQISAKLDLLLSAQQLPPQPGYATAQQFQFVPQPAQHQPMFAYDPVQQHPQMPPHYQSMPAYVPVQQYSQLQPLHQPERAPAAASPKTPLSNSMSPLTGRFEFICPLCTRVQYTPKSHCGHIRKILDCQSSHFCQFRVDIPFHASIIHVWGDVSNFVDWYCRPMRSSVGSNFTDRDIEDYRKQQSELHTIVARGCMQ